MGLAVNHGSVTSRLAPDRTVRKRVASPGRESCVTYSFRYNTTALGILLTPLLLRIALLRTSVVLVTLLTVSPGTATEH